MLLTLLSSQPRIIIHTIIYSLYSYNLVKYPLENSEQGFSNGSLMHLVPCSVNIQGHTTIIVAISKNPIVTT